MPRAEPAFTALDSPSLQFLPRQEEAPGWRLEEDPIVVPAPRFKDYFGEEAATLLRYEALDASIGKYSVPGNPGFALVEIFRFPDFVKAFGAYSMRKKGPIQHLDIANESFRSKHGLHLWRGPFYIRILGANPSNQEATRTLLTSVAERMPAAAGKPAVFNFFPTDTRVPNSERFSAEEGFGQAYLGNSFQATFNVGGALIDGLVIPAANKAAAARILEAYRGLYVRNGKLLDSIPNLGEDNFSAEDRFLGRAVAFRLDRFVIAFNGYQDRQKLVELAAVTDTRILGSIRKQLVLADEAAEERANPTASTQPEWMRRP